MVDPHHLNSRIGVLSGRMSCNGSSGIDGMMMTMYLGDNGGGSSSSILDSITTNTDWPL